MAGVNKVFLVGRLTKDADLKMTTTGIPVTKFTLAVDRFGKDKGADFFNIVAWKKLAEICGEYLKKGMLIAVVGQLQTRTWEKDGIKHWATDVVINEMTMCSSPKRQEPDEAVVPDSDLPDSTKNAPEIPGTDNLNEELPF